MFAFRGTSKLLERMKLEVQASAASTTRLGDWYATLVSGRGPRLVLCVAERTLLPVVLPAVPLQTIPFRLAEAAANVLHAVGVGSDAVAREVAGMREWRVARTASRSVVGSMNDFGRLVEGYREEFSDPFHLSLRLADAPCRPIAWMSPSRATREVFEVAFTASW